MESIVQWAEFVVEMYPTRTNGDMDRFVDLWGPPHYCEHGDPKIGYQWSTNGRSLLKPVLE